MGKGLERYLPSCRYRCMHPDHPGKKPSVWELKHKCNGCRHLMTLEEFKDWCASHKVFFIGG